MTERSLLPQIREDLEVETLCAFCFKNILNQEITVWLDHMEEVSKLYFLTLVSPPNPNGNQSILKQGLQCIF